MADNEEQVDWEDGDEGQDFWRGPEPSGVSAVTQVQPVAADDDEDDVISLLGDTVGEYLIFRLSVFANNHTAATPATAESATPAPAPAPVSAPVSAPAPVRDPLSNGPVTDLPGAACYTLLALTGRLDFSHVQNTRPQVLYSHCNGTASMGSPAC